MRTGQVGAPDLYLDIESDGARITVLGLLSSESGMHQWIGPNIPASAFRSTLPRHGRIFTMNGKGFDLPRVRRATGVDLEDRFESIDLLYPARRAGLRGGQKVIERAADFRRYDDIKNLNGRHAIYLWRKFRRGDTDALRILLRYNRADLYGLLAIHRYFEGEGIL